MGGDEEYEKIDKRDDIVIVHWQAGRQCDCSIPKKKSESIASTSVHKGRELYGL